MSLQDKVISSPKGSLTSPQAASVNKKGQIQEKKYAENCRRHLPHCRLGNREPHCRRSARGVDYLDAGDYLEVAQEKRRFLEDKVGKIRVTAVFYTHSHYAIGAKARQDENTRFYWHDILWRP